MITVRSFVANDLSAFVPIEALEPLDEHNKELLAAMEESELAVTAIKDNVVIGCGGVHPVDEGHGELWFRLSRECLNYKIETVRLIKDGLKIIEENYPFKRLSATIKCCFEQSVNMAERFGFKKMKEVIFEGEQWFIYSKEIS